MAGSTLIYVYCPKRSSGAGALVKWLNEQGANTVRLKRPPITPDSGLFVNWGAIWPKSSGHRVLNKRVIHNKYKELQILSKAGVECVEADLEHHEGWLARKFKHQEANDLLANLATGDYYTKFREISQEFRVHVFKERSIRLAVKVPRIPHPNPRFRSWQEGWKFSYDGVSGAPDLRRIAKRAVKALELDFGAVDIGREPNGKLFVLEVNTRPGLEGGTIAAYGRHIMEEEGK